MPSCRLIKLLRSPEPDVRASAVWALGEIEDTRATEPLIPMLKDPSPVVQVTAAEALGQIEDKRAVQALLPLLKSKIRTCGSPPPRRWGRSRMRARPRHWPRQ